MLTFQIHFEIFVFFSPLKYLYFQDVIFYLLEVFCFQGSILSNSLNLRSFCIGLTTSSNLLLILAANESLGPYLGVDFHC